MNVAIQGSMRLIIGWTKIEIFAAQWRHVVFCSLLGSESPVYTGSSQHGIQTTKGSDSAVDSSPFFTIELWSPPM